MGQIKTMFHLIGYNLCDAPNKGTYAEFTCEETSELPTIREILKKKKKVKKSSKLLVKKVKKR